VPFLDLDPFHRGPKAGLLDEIAELIESGAFTNGPQVSAFGDAFARYCLEPGDQLS
jgi:dTDP-4-amino-4,6-dideoxygalactose transaminase